MKKNVWQFRGGMPERNENVKGTVRMHSILCEKDLQGSAKRMQQVRLHRDINRRVFVIKPGKAVSLMEDAAGNKSAAKALRLKKA